MCVRLKFEPVNFDFLLSRNKENCRLLVGITMDHNAYAGHLHMITMSETNIGSSCKESDDSTEHNFC